MQCPTCGAPVDVSDHFCGACGERLALPNSASDAAQQAQPIVAAPPSQGRQPGGAGTSEAQQAPLAERTVVVRKRAPILAYLVEKEGEQAGRVFKLGGDITDVGRDRRNQVMIGDVLVSGYHLRIKRTPDGQFLVTDRGSSNGTLLNDEPLTQPRPLNENDQLRIGNTTLVLKVVE